MNRIVRSIVLVVAGMLCIAGCDEQGLNPHDVVEPGFGGTITYISKKPPADSIRDLRIVAVPYFPVDTLFQPLILKVIEGVIPFSDDLRQTVDSGKTVHYDFFVKPKTYYYVAIVQQFGIDVFSQWKVVAVYSSTGNDSIPTPVIITDGVFKRNINFTVDFYNLPPQPFRVP